MTFGEKLSSLRKQANLSQKALAEKLNVSRQAVTKWENNIGLPDIDNLKKISSLFSITIDELLDYKIENITAEFDTKEETIDKENSKLKNVFNFILNKFSDADSIFQLSRELKLTFWQSVLDFFIGAGILEIADIAKTGFVYPFLIVKEDNEYLVLVSKEKLLTKKLNEKFANKTKIIDGYKYTKIKSLKLKNN